MVFSTIRRDGKKINFFSFFWPTVEMEKRLTCFPHCSKWRHISKFSSLKRSQASAHRSDNVGSSPLHQRGVGVSMGWSPWDQAEWGGVSSSPDQTQTPAWDPELPPIRSQHLCRNLPIRKDGFSPVYCLWGHLVPSVPCGLTATAP